ncbi:MAG: hypothetical protein K9M11_01140 [Candidatus Pacebacteria bacterium]|nr:hypothetical protein [Candidatus Paceibacterota bacterium]
MISFNITLIVVIAILTALSFYKGKSTLFSLIVSFYPAAILYASFPYKAKFILFKDSGEHIFYSHAIIFGIFFILSFLIARRIVHSSGTRSGIVGFLDALFLSASVVILTLALCFHILPYRDIYNLGAQFQNFFSSSLGYFVSVFIPMVVVYGMTGRRY